MSLKNKPTRFVLVLVFISTSLFSQTYTFTTAGATGRYGPTQSQVNTAYASTNLNAAVTVSSGIQSWTVPASGIYRIECYGAGGALNYAFIPGGLGAKMQGDFAFTNGQVLKIVAGQQGGNGLQGGGSGGTFVTDNSNTPFIIAGGGGAAHYLTTYSFGIANMSGTTSTSGLSGMNSYTNIVAGAGGSSGGGGSVSTTYSIGQGSGGGGLLTDGVNGNPSTGGMAFVNGANGGAAGSSTSGIAGDGGFGGGGGGDWAVNTGAGGGGGYSGGGGGAAYGCGGGGGSFNAGSNQTNVSGFNAGQGYVIFTKISGLNIVQTASIACNGQLTAALTASAFGGTAPYSYSWTPNVGTGSVVTALGAGSYTCRVTDASAVVYTSTFTIVQPPVLSLVVASKSNVSCNGGANGAITATASGGVGSYTYTWSPVFTLGSTISNIPIGSYTCTAADANGCNTSTAVTITQPAPLSIIGIASTPTLCSGATCVLVGAGAQTYTWSGGVTNGVPFAPAASANYTVTGTDAAGCTAAAVVFVTVNSSPTVSIAGSASVCAGASLVLTASGAPSFTWNTSATSAAISLTPAATANYTVVGENVNGCQNTAIKTVSVINSTTVSANASSTAVCIGSPLTLNGSGASSYTWTGGVSNNVSFTPTLSNTYTVTGTGACGTASATISVLVNALPVVTANASSTVVCFGGTVTLSGSGALTYNWSGGISNNLPFAPFSTTTYALIGTDANGCQNTASKTVSVNPLPLVVANASNSVVCLGNPVTLFGSGAQSYTWTGGVSDNLAFSPAATSAYTVTGTDLNGCKNSAVKTVTVIGLPLVTANSSTNAVCAGNAVTLFGSGASSYTWSNGVTNNSAFTPTITNTYTLSGSNACFTNTSVVTVTVNSLPVIVANVSNSVICFGNSTTLFGSGGISYFWSGGITNNVSFTPVVSANYTVTGTGANGCQSTATRSVTVNALPVITTSVTQSVVCYGISVILNAAGALTYTWSAPVINNVAFTPSITSTYTITGTDANGCQNTALRTVTVNQLPVVTASVTNSVVCSGDLTTLTGSGANTYTWSGGVPNGIPFAPGTTDTYSLAGTNTLTGCTSTNVSVITVSVNPIPFVQVNATNPVICLGGTVSLSGTNADTYTWTGGITNGAPFSPTATTLYVVSGTNTLTGCTSGTTQQVVVNPLPNLIINVTGSVICNGQSVAFGASGADTYSWTNGISNGIPFFPSTNADYTVTATNTLTGCFITAVRSVTVNPLPVVTANTSNAFICIGGSVALTGNGANVYSWTGGVLNGVAFSPSLTTTYSVVGIYTLTGCSSTNAAVQTITVNNLPVILASTSTPTLCAGESASITASGASSYSWSNGQTGSVNVVSPTSITLYTVSGTDANGCTNSTVFAQTVSECLGINSSYENENRVLKIFPNPNAGSFEVSAEVEMELSIINELGQIVSAVRLNQMNQNKVQVKELPNGIYFIIGTNKTDIKQKVIVSR